MKEIKVQGLHKHKVFESVDVYEGNQGIGFTQTENV